MNNLPRSRNGACKFAHPWTRRVCASSRNWSVLLLTFVKQSLIMMSRSNTEKKQEMKTTKEYEQKLEAMEEHLDDLIFDMVQTIQSFEDLGMRHLSGLESHLMQAKTQLITAREVMWRDCEE